VFFGAVIILPFVAGEYFLSVGLGLLMWIALTQSWSLLSGMTGYISLGHVVFYGLGAYLAALSWGQLPLWAVLALAGAGNFAFATAISLPVLRVRGPYFVILTFGLAELVKFSVMAIESALGEYGRLLFDVPSMATLYWLMLGFAAIATAATQLILSTRLGQGLIAIREDEETAETVGVPVTIYKSLAFGLSAAIPGVVGALMMLRTTYFEPQQVFDPIVSFTIVSIAIIGGSDDSRGPLFGAVFLVLLSELFWAKAPQVYLILQGILLIGFVVFLPEGICGRLFAQRARR
jgi:branched-chain amino acid transport system permease protein